MQLLLRPVNDRFFQEQVLPFLALAMADSARAMESLRGQLADDQVRLLCERLLSSHAGGGLGGVEHEPWAELVERLTFPRWGEGPSGGWEVVGEWKGYAADWDEALHLSLMLEDPGYPYWDARAARGRRDGFRQHPVPGLGLASLIGGHWAPFPPFPPDRVFSTVGRGEYVPREQYAFADWAWRPAQAVEQWNAQLESKLRRLLAREQERLRPVELPETDEVLAWWLGRSPEPPVLSVAFSGLGPQASSWIRELGVLTAHSREAVQEKAGLVMLTTRSFKSRQA